MKKNPVQKLVVPNALSATILFLLFALLFGSFLSATRVEPDNIFDVYLFNRLHSLFVGHTLVFLISASVFIALLAFLLFQCNEKFSFIRVRTMIPTLFFIFLLTTSDYQIEHCSGLLTCLFILVAVWIFLSAYQEREPVGKVFNTFFFVSAGSFFSVDLLLLIPVCWISFSFLRIGSIRTLLASFTGLLVPYIIGLPILLLTGTFYEFLYSMQQQFMMFSVYNLNSPLLPYQIFFFILFLISFINFLANINSDKIKTRKILYFFYLFAFSLLINTAMRGSFINMFPAIALLSSIVAGHYFSLKNSLLAFVFFIAVIIIPVVFYFI